MEPVLPGVSAAMVGDRIRVVNQTSDTVHVTITLEAPLLGGTQLTDVSTDRIVIDSQASQRSAFDLRLREWDLRTLLVK